MLHTVECLLVLTCDRFAKFEYAESRITFESKNVCSSHKAIVWLENTWNRTHKLYGQLYVFFCICVWGGKKQFEKKNGNLISITLKTFKIVYVMKILLHSLWWTVFFRFEGVWRLFSSCGMMGWKVPAAFRISAKVLHHLGLLLTASCILIIHFLDTYTYSYMNNSYKCIYAFLVIFWLKWYSDIMENV